MVSIAFGRQCVGFKPIKIIGLSTTLLLAVFSMQLFAAPEVIASGLFKDKALLTIDGKPRLLKVGTSSPEGVTLLRSDSQQANILIEGRTLTLHLTERISTAFKKPKFSEVKIPRSPNGHYFTSGSINGRSAKFMVDTGATAIAMNINEASRLGIDLRKAKAGMSSTAGGMVKTFRVMLDKVSVGNVTLHSIPASVVDGDFPEQILLGNSFLSKVEMTEQAGVLVFRKKY
ncbi:MAG: TIGR02281 family clan AA aspartic protease [Porticoccaceae bacterium]|nr:TIGR02281 family clan AA aspartic protease [Porticoccaceae bacterium]